MKIISGMHRSGTSLVARLFYESGADMGNPNTFYRPDKWNPDGYFEQPDIHAINMPLINGYFWKLAYFWLPSTKTILKRATYRTEQIYQIATKYKGKIVKETRFCLTLPAWIQSGAQIDKILICLRDPIQVAKSLQKRNKITLKHAYYLWLVHNQRLLENAANIPLWFVYYRNLLDKNRIMAEITPALQFFDLDMPKEKLEQLTTSIVKPQMNHNIDNQIDYPDYIESMWYELLGQHARQFKKI